MLQLGATGIEEEEEEEYQNSSKTLECNVKQRSLNIFHDQSCSVGCLTTLCKYSDFVIER
jgi:hypothetical protein